MIYITLGLSFVCLWLSTCCLYLSKEVRRLRKNKEHAKPTAIRCNDVVLEIEKSIIEDALKKMTEQRDYYKRLAYAVDEARINLAKTLTAERKENNNNG